MVDNTSKPPSVQKLIQLLIQTKFPVEQLDMERYFFLFYLFIFSLIAGKPDSFLSIIHFFLFQFSRHLCELITPHASDLLFRGDARFVEGFFKLMQECMNIRPEISKNQFLSNGFVDKKCQILMEVISFAKRVHTEKAKTYARRDTQNDQKVEALPADKKLAKPPIRKITDSMRSTQEAPLPAPEPSAVFMSLSDFPVHSMESGKPNNSHWIEGNSHRGNKNGMEQNDMNQQPDSMTSPYPSNLPTSVKFVNPSENIKNKPNGAFIDNNERVWVPREDFEALEYRFLKFATDMQKTVDDLKSQISSLMTLPNQYQSSDLVRRTAEFPITGSNSVSMGNSFRFEDRPLKGSSDERNTHMDISKNDHHQLQNILPSSTKMILRNSEDGDFPNSRTAAVTSDEHYQEEHGMTNNPNILTDSYLNNQSYQINNNSLYMQDNNIHNNFSYNNSSQLTGFRTPATRNNSKPATLPSPASASRISAFRAVSLLGDQPTPSSIARIANTPEPNNHPTYSSSKNHAGGYGGDATTPIRGGTHLSILNQLPAVPSISPIYHPISHQQVHLNNPINAVSSTHAASNMRKVEETRLLVQQIAKRFEQTEHSIRSVAGNNTSRPATSITGY